MFVSCINTAVSAHLILECEATMHSTPGGNNSTVQQVASGTTGLHIKSNMNAFANEIMLHVVYKLPTQTEKTSTESNMSSKSVFFNKHDN